MLLALVTLEKADLFPAAPRPFLGPGARNLQAFMRAQGLDLAGAHGLVKARPAPAPYRELLFYGQGPEVRVAARCLVLLRDRSTVDRILRRAEAGDLEAMGYPAALFGWVVGASYRVGLLPRLRRLLSSQDTRTRIFALEALRTLTFLRWRMPGTEPRFANPGEVRAMRRWCYRIPGSTDVWLRKRAEPVLERMARKAERREAARFFARFLK